MGRGMLLRLLQPLPLEFSDAGRAYVVKIARSWDEEPQALRLWCIAAFARFDWEQPLCLSGPFADRSTAEVAGDVGFEVNDDLRVMRIVRFLVDQRLALVVQG